MVIEIEDLGSHLISLPRMRRATLSNEGVEAVNAPRWLLLGNGASVAFDAEYNYRNLFDKAPAMPDHLQRLIASYSHNFELAMAELACVANGVPPQGATALLPQNPAAAHQDLQVLRMALLTAIRRTNDTVNSAFGPAAASRAIRSKLTAGFQFISQFQGVFTTNYDLVLYYSLMGNRTEGFDWGDGFFDRDMQGRLFFHSFKGPPKKEVFYLHGALHLTPEAEFVPVRTRKLTREYDEQDPRSDTSILFQVSKRLEHGKVPLLVTEGQAAVKREMIGRNPYLARCHENFARIQGNLVVYGHSLSRVDDHIIEALARNRGLFSVTATYHDPSKRADFATRLGRINALRVVADLPEIPLFLIHASRVRLWDA